MEAKHIGGVTHKRESERRKRERSQVEARSALP